MTETGMKFGVNAKTIKIAIIGVVVVVLIAIVGSLLGTINSLRNAGIDREVALSAQYKNNQNELSAYILSFKESLGVAVAGNDKLEEILIEAVKGRYGDDANGVDPTGGTLFSAIAEAYPDLSKNAELYAKVQDTVVSGRAEYKNVQNKLSDMVAEYNAWRAKGLIDHLIIEALGFPSDTLTAVDGGVKYTGTAALERIDRVILVQGAVDAYESGTDKPLIGDDE